MIRFLKLTAVVLLAVVLSACIEEQVDDYCKNHYAFHSEHASEIGNLHAVLTSEGLFTVQLTLPATAYSADQVNSMTALLQDSGNVYTLSSENTCQPTTAHTSQNDNALDVTYESQCGIDNRLGQVDVLLFDSMAALDEITVSIITPATSKHFAISRQCDAAIFRLHSSTAQQ